MSVPAPTQPRSGAEDRIPELESLRGVMAWWVVISHALALSSATAPFGGRLWDALGDGRGAVQVFMILSGFVIAHLLLSKREPWTVYITRRFFRIFPLYATCLVLSVALIPWEREALKALAGDSVVLARAAERFEAGLARPWLVLPLKLTMLHGVPPESWLPNLAGAYLGPGWSISTEWQFYLLAPACLGLAARRPSAAGWGVGIALFVLVSRKLDNDAFVGRYAHLFFLGSVSAIGYRWLRGLPPGAAQGALLWIKWGSAAAAAFLWATVPAWPTDAWPLTVWLICFWAVATRDLAPSDAVGAAVRSLLGSGPLRFSGRVSYSTYLVHLPILLCLAAAIERLARPPRGLALMGCLLAGGVPLILLGSYLAFRFIEQPGIRLGRRWLGRGAGGLPSVAARPQPTAL